MNEYVTRPAVMLSIAKEYNRRRSGEGLRLAWIEKAVNETPDVWHYPDDLEDGLPKTDEFVLGLLTGIVSGIRNEHAPHIINWMDDGCGWALVNELDLPGDSWEVDKWMYIPEGEAE